MASGTFERPLPNPTQERSLLQISGIRAKTLGIPAYATRYITIDKGVLRTGAILMSANTASKHGFYIYGGAASQDGIVLTAVHAITQSGYTITTSGNVITIKNGAEYAQGTILWITGAEPIISTTAPT